MTISTSPDMIQPPFYAVDAHIPLLNAAIRIPPPGEADDSALDSDYPIPSSVTTGAHQHIFPGSDTVVDSNGRKSSISRSRLASFPPPSLSASKPQDGSSSSTGKDKEASTKSALPSSFTGTLSGGVTDILLSSILPSSIPKAAPSSSQPTSRTKQVRPLTSQREPLSLPAMTNNFRRFVARCGIVFWLQDRVEETLFWKKPVWTWAWFLVWGFISFYPRLLLLVPSAVIVLVILNQYEKSHPSVSNQAIYSGIPGQTGAWGNPTSNPYGSSATSSNYQPPSSSPTTSTSRSIFSKPIAATIAATLTSNTDASVNPKNRVSGSGGEQDGHGHGHFGEEGEGKPGGHTVDPTGREIPSAPPGSADSGVDYLMNLQGIQNLMGVISDVHDAALPYISLISPNSPNPNPPPTTFPLSPTHLLILSLLPTLTLPLLPASFLPWILVAVGYIPPIIFHPNFDFDLIRSFLSRHAPGPGGLRAWRAEIERRLLTDRLDDQIAKSEIREVHVWENERLDPTWLKNTVSKVIQGNQEVPNALETPPGFAWSGRHLKPTDKQPWIRALPRNPNESLWEDEPVRVLEGDAGRVSLTLVSGWSFVPNEEWRVDYAASWAGGAADDDGWVYTDEEWKNPRTHPVIWESLLSKNSTKEYYSVTRRRKWWRRVYSDAK